jgi:hypothetical protein
MARMNCTSSTTDSGSAVEGRNATRNCLVWNWLSAIASSTVGTSAAKPGMRKPAEKIPSKTCPSRPGEVTMPYAAGTASTIVKAAAPRATRAELASPGPSWASSNALAKFPNVTEVGRAKGVSRTERLSLKDETIR